MTRVPLVLDVDTGVDDACALLLAALDPDADLRAVTCVAGNADLDDVVRNTLLVLQSCGREDVPVAVGSARPVLERPRRARQVHGDDGMGDLGWPAPGIRPDPRPAVDVLAEAVDRGASQGRPVTLVPLAPMTNIALFARVHPQAFARLGRIVFMGGGARVSNATASAEFNIFADPEAAAVVLDASVEHDVPTLMYGLDVFYEPVVSRAQVESLAGRGERGPGDLAVGLVDVACTRFASPAATLGDAGAVAVALDPALVTTRRWPVRVELAGRWTRGRTVVDERDAAHDRDHDPHGLAPAEVDVAVEVDGPGIVGRWLAAIGQAGS